MGRSVIECPHRANFKSARDPCAGPAPTSGPACTIHWRQRIGGDVEPDAGDHHRSQQSPKAQAGDSRPPNSTAKAVSPLPDPVFQSTGMAVRAACARGQGIPGEFGSKCKAAEMDRSSLICISRASTCLAVTRYTRLLLRLRPVLSDSNPPNTITSPGGQQIMGEDLCPRNYFNNSFNNWTAAPGGVLSQTAYLPTLTLTMPPTNGSERCSGWHQLGQLAQGKI